MKEHNFTSAKFMRKEEKEKVLKDWKLFVRNGLSHKTFTKRIYEHLTLHCMFIAHYSKDGFYSVYFVDPEDTLKFLRQFDKDFNFKSIEYGSEVWLKGEYEDINRAMCEEVERVKQEMCEKLKLKIRKSALRKVEELCEEHGLKAHEIKERRAK